MSALANVPEQGQQPPLTLNLDCWKNPNLMKGAAVSRTPSANTSLTAAAYGLPQQGSVYPLSTDMGYGSSLVGDGLQTVMSAGFVGGSPSNTRQMQDPRTIVSNAERLLLAAEQNNSRVARNGREQQRAQKISDMIDKLKRLLDRAEFTSGDASSKLDVLTNCEGYLSHLLDKMRCYEFEAKLRLIAGGSKQDPHANRNRSSNSSRSSSYPTRRDSTGNVSDSVDSGRSREVSSSSSIPSSYARGIKNSRSSFYGARSASGSSVDDDGDAHSTMSTFVGTTESAGLGSTTDTASRGFTTDSGYGDGSIVGDSGSADGGDTTSGGYGGSADGGSEESDEGGAVGSRMRVVNYFDIFRLSNVPMAIASKDGRLVDVNDAMRGFGRISEDTVKTLTVKCLVSPESAQALDEAMNKMLASSRKPQGGGSGGAVGVGDLQTEGAQPFLANAGIGDRPTLLTVSLVYDERGESSAFHVALIPRSKGSVTTPAPEAPAEDNIGSIAKPPSYPHRSSSGDQCGATSQTHGVGGAGKTAGGRSFRPWELEGADGQTYPSKRPAIG